MIDDDTIKKMATQAGLGLIEIIGLDDRERAFARAIWSHGRQAGLEEAAVTAWTQYMEACRKMHLPPPQWESFLVASAIRTLKENKHER